MWAEEHMRGAQAFASPAASGVYEDPRFRLFVNKLSSSSSLGDACMCSAPKRKEGLCPICAADGAWTQASLAADPEGDELEELARSFRWLQLTDGSPSLVKKRNADQPDAVDEGDTEESGRDSEERAVKRSDAEDAFDVLVSCCMHSDATRKRPALRVVRRGEGSGVCCSRRLEGDETGMPAKAKEANTEERETRTSGPLQRSSSILQTLASPENKQRNTWSATAWFPTTVP
ncbi:hypothetical protein BESB_003600 [Besnoitia besnoiti]|uniref:Uncharacterized protein n=1 Tax=Besnoitia besnoiti TaxID=94643 RepID=A0A2A9MJD0_BESBE|nr:hypothetical protein BESB_003600 [Besnoitia besnoiti]PFH38019.1 hypothetical protein BESB_003600 [Besnoitia besnoiti]